jgi:hypothetical protein
MGRADWRANEKHGASRARPANEADRDADKPFGPTPVRSASRTVQDATGAETAQIAAALVAGAAFC